MIEVYSPGSTTEADIIKNIFEAADVYCFIQGYEHRSLLGFLGSYIKLRILVPSDKKREAEEIIQSYLSSNLLDAVLEISPETLPFVDNPEVNDKPRRRPNWALGCFLAICFPGLGSLYAGHRDAGFWITVLASITICLFFTLELSRELYLIYLLFVLLYLCLIILDLILTLHAVITFKQNADNTPTAN